ncbi:GNAT family N-acetyltransferase [Streptomyces graminilatus]|uniref:GNAT family N-acetyltransferase n=1 Tax=Streptomyces graminilatus TaxID=1464070 RepID=UPI0006E28092|nr:GNAT family N-acetyltransferase [Streptomyces graminilatus]
MSSFVVRSVRADEWRAAKELRLAALRDPVADIAFLETYDEAVGRPDSFWQERVQRVAEEATSAQQIIAEGPDGEWVGGLVVLVEEAGTTDWSGVAVEQRQGHIVGVFMLPEHRGCGLTDVLFDAALEWAWESAGVDRVRLIVHQDNARAQRFYRRVGFVPSGVTMSLDHGSQGSHGSEAEGDTELEFVLERESHL